MFELAQQEEKSLLKLAYQAIEAGLSGKSVTAPNQIQHLNGQFNGVFVTLYTQPNLELRGCIGMIRVVDNFEESIAAMAASAAFEDPRFAPLRSEELDHIKIEISLLHKPRLVRNPGELATLDPKKDGVIVRNSFKQGLLLPDIDGVDSVEQQIQIAKQKARIQPGENYELETFTVTKIR